MAFAVCIYVLYVIKRCFLHIYLETWWSGDQFPNLSSDWLVPRCCCCHRRCDDSKSSDRAGWKRSSFHFGERDSRRKFAPEFCRRPMWSPCRPFHRSCCCQWPTVLNNPFPLLWSERWVTYFYRSIYHRINQRCLLNEYSTLLLILLLKDVAIQNENVTWLIVFLILFVFRHF